MVYKESKLSLTIAIVFIGIIVPMVTNFIFSKLFITMYNETNFNITIHILFFFIAITLSTQYNANIVINNYEIARNSLFGSRTIKWDEIINVKYKKLFNKIYLYKNGGQYLMFSNNIINYKLLYKEIYEQIKLHNNESIVDKSFLGFINSI